MEEFEGGGMDGIAAKVAEEIFVLFKDGDGDAGAGEEEAEHHAGGATADDAAGGGVRIGGGGHVAVERSKRVEARQKEFLDG